MVQPHSLLVIEIAEEDKLCMFFKCTLHVCTNHTLCRDRGGVWGPFGPVPASIGITRGGGGV